MLRIARARDLDGRYYTADLTWTPRPRPTARWAGTAAAQLGLAGVPDADALVRLLHGAHPATGRAMRRRAATVAAYDLTFAAPKSVSVLHGLATDDVRAEITAAQRAAVHAALGYVETRAASVRTARDGAHRAHGVERVQGQVAAAFEHATSRALDPHLHTHVLVVNLGRGEDGRWRALDGRGLFAHARAAGALYDAQLRHELAARVGARWSARRGGTFEIDQMDAMVLAAFSGRRAEIAADAHLRAAPGAPASPRQRAVAWAATRPPRRRDVDMDALRDAWRSRLALVADGALIERCTASRGRDATAAAGTIEEYRFAAVLHRSASEPRRRDVVEAWASSVSAGLPADAVAACVERLADWSTAPGVAEAPCRWRDVVPTAALRRILGPRPAFPAALGRWQALARDVAAYRRQWGATDRSLVPETCLEPAALARLPVRRLAEHVTLARRIADFREGRGNPPEPRAGLDYPLRRREEAPDLGLG